MNHKVTLPSIKHVFDSIFPVESKHHRRSSSLGMESTLEAARSLQQMSSVCYHCYQQQQQQQHCSQKLVHRRTISASFDQMPYYQPMPMRRARAHTTSGYPPTMVYPHKVYPKQEPELTEKKPKTSTNHRYHCHHCSKSFSRPSSLRIHIYSHTGEKPFKCHFQGCGRSFSVHSNMRRHLRVHYYPTQQQQQQQQQIHNSMRLPIVPQSVHETSL